MTKAKFLALGLAAACLCALPARAADELPTPPMLKWSFAGPFGLYDHGQLQRGFKIYQEVCKACHGLTLLSFRNLAEEGGPSFTTAQAAEIAKQYEIADINDQGQPTTRPGRPADHIPSPFPNEQAARAANNGVLPPDLSVIAKARTYERGFPWFVFDMLTQFQEQGVDYIAALLTGYEDPPQGVTMLAGMSYNKYFPGHSLAMPKMLVDGQVAYTDGTPTTAAQYAKDIAAFLMWAAEPHLEVRKRIGFQVMIFLVVFAGLMYFTKRKVWSTVEGHA